MDGLIGAILAIKEAVFSEDSFSLSEISSTYDVSESTLVSYENLLKKFRDNPERHRMYRNQTSIWTDEEIAITTLYVFDIGDQKTKKDIFSDIASVINRTMETVRYVYYTKVGNSKTRNRDDILSSFDLLLPNSNSDSFEQKEENTMSPSPVKQQDNEQSNEDTLLQDLSFFLENAEKIPNLDVKGLFRGLSQLSKSAIMNSGYSTEMKRLKEKAKEMEEKVDEVELEKEELAEKIEEMKNVVSWYDALTSAQKLTQLPNYQKKLKALLS
jgi:chemotaxis protein histidine kinase CheA